jgi:hypothetical protein
MFTTSDKISPDPTKDKSTLTGAKAAGDFLLDFGHAQVIFALVIGERDISILHEA